MRITPLLGPYRRVLWWSWGGGLFLMSEVPLCIAAVLAATPVSLLERSDARTGENATCDTPGQLQGYLAHQKTPTPLGPPSDPRHRPTVGS